MTGLMSTFQKKIVSGHDVTDDVINVIYDVISASKLENAITLLFFNRFEKLCNNHRYTLYDVISIISDYRIFMK